MRDQDFGQTCTAEASGPWCRPDLTCGVCESGDLVSTCQIPIGGEQSDTRIERQIPDFMFSVRVLYQLSYSSYASSGFTSQTRVSCVTSTM